MCEAGALVERSQVRPAAAAARAGAAAQICRRSIETAFALQHGVHSAAVSLRMQGTVARYINARRGCTHGLQAVQGGGLGCRLMAASRSAACLRLLGGRGHVDLVVAVEQLLGRVVDCAGVECRAEGKISKDREALPAVGCPTALCPAAAPPSLAPACTHPRPRRRRRRSRAPRPPAPSAGPGPPAGWCLAGGGRGGGRAAQAECESAPNLHPHAVPQPWHNSALACSSHPPGPHPRWQSRRRRARRR